MFLSKLTLNPSPAARAVQRDLASPYELHRTLMRGFPDKICGGPGRVLFRVEPTREDDPPVVLVQSEKSPDWSSLLHDGHYLLAAHWKEVRISVAAGQPLRFRFRANPTVRRAGKRMGLVRCEEQRKWLERKAAAAGFALLDFTVRRSARYVSRVRTGERSGTQTHLGVDYEGLLKVTDRELFAAALAGGIGSAKGYGFGLLSVAPAS
jgi:CRISPR system Cascade subunit CasE